MRPMYKSFLAIVVLLAMCVCATTQSTQTAVTGFQATGTFLTQAHDTVAALKTAGKLSPAQEAQFNALYAKAVAAYAALGQAAIIAIQAPSQSAQATVTAATTLLTSLIAQVTTFLSGVKLMDPATLAILVTAAAQITSALVAEIQSNTSLTPETQAQLIAQIQAAISGVPTNPV